MLEVKLATQAWYTTHCVWRSLLIPIFCASGTPSWPKQRHWDNKQYRLYFLMCGALENLLVFISLSLSYEPVRERDSSRKLQMTHPLTIRLPCRPQIAVEFQAKIKRKKILRVPAWSNTPDTIRPTDPTISHHFTVCYLSGAINWCCQS